MDDSQKCKFLDEPVNIISCQHIVFLCSSLCFRHITSATLIYSHTYHQKIALNLKLSFCSKSTICFSLRFFLLSNQGSFRMRRLIDTPDIIKLKCSAISVGVMMSFSLSSNNMRLLLSSESAFQGEPIDFIYILYSYISI